MYESINNWKLFSCSEPNQNNQTSGSGTDMPDFIRSYSCNVSYVEIVDKVVAKIIIVEFTISLCSLLRFMISSPFFTLCIWYSQLHKNVDNSTS